MNADEIGKVMADLTTKLEGLMRRLPPPEEQIKMERSVFLKTCAQAFRDAAIEIEGMI